MSIKRAGFIMFIFVTGIIGARQAVFINPVTDLGNVSLPVYSFFDVLTPNICDRAHQALFNEVCEVIEEKNNKVRVVLPNVIYKNKKQLQVEPSTFWAPRASLLFFDDLRPCPAKLCAKPGAPDKSTCQIEQSLFPQSLSSDYFKNNNNGDTIVLTMPWQDPITKSMYSAGTRFVRSFKDSSKYYGITFFDVRRKKKAFSRVIKKYARIEKNMQPKEAQKMFVSLLYSWANLHNGVIPYVWGGSSFIYTQTNDSFIIDKHSPHGIYYSNKLPITGYDCSELILRAAQICGIPYFCKLSFIIHEHLRLLRPEEDIVAGDILWYKGHVMIVGDVARNELIESRGYQTGYGKVHAIELNKLFPELVTYNDLKQKYLNKEPFALLYKDGTLVKNFNTFKIFKLSSIWDK